MILIILIGLAIALLVQNLFYQPSMGWHPPEDPEESKRTRKYYIDLWNGPLKLEANATGWFSIDVRVQTAKELKTIVELLEIKKYESQHRTASVKRLIEHREEYPELPVYTEQISPPYEHPDIAFRFEHHTPITLRKVTLLVQDRTYRKQLNTEIARYSIMCKDSVEKIKKAIQGPITMRILREQLSKQQLMRIKGSIEDILKP